VSRESVFRLVIGLVAVSVGAAGLAACDFGGASGADGLGCNPKNTIAADSADHHVFRDALVSATTNALNFAQGEINTTDVTVTFSASLTSKTDVHMEDAAYTNYCGFQWVSASAGGLAGLATCISLNTANECEQHEVRVSRLVSESFTTIQVRNMVTHEMGHSLGLGHQGDENDLMSGAGINNQTHLNSHEKQLINDYY